MSHLKDWHTIFLALADYRRYLTGQIGATDPDIIVGRACIALAYVALVGSLLWGA